MTHCPKCGKWLIHQDPATHVCPPEWSVSLHLRSVPDSYLTVHNRLGTPQVTVYERTAREAAQRGTRLLEEALGEQWCEEDTKIGVFVRRVDNIDDPAQFFEVWCCMSPSYYPASEPGSEWQEYMDALAANSGQEES